MQDQNTPETVSYQTTLEVAIGQRIVELLDLNVSKVTGRLKTTWGSKSVTGLGSCVNRIVAEEVERLKDFNPTT